MNVIGADPRAFGAALEQRRAGCGAIFEAFAVANEDLISGQIQVFHPQIYALAE